MDLLRRGWHVDVLEPKELRDEVNAELAKSLQNFTS
jgi:predicted DNA-binding transcriptional regulator YafY